MNRSWKLDRVSGKKHSTVHRNTLVGITIPDKKHRHIGPISISKNPDVREILTSGKARSTSRQFRVEFRGFSGLTPTRRCVAETRTSRTNLALNILEVLAIRSAQTQDTAASPAPRLVKLHARPLLSRMSVQLRHARAATVVRLVFAARPDATLPLSRLQSPVYRRGDSNDLASATATAREVDPADVSRADRALARATISAIRPAEQTARVAHGRTGRASTSAASDRSRSF